MIVRQKPNAFQLLFIVRGSIVLHILPQIIGIALLGGAVALAQHYFPAFFPNYSPAAFALLGVALSLFLGFRNNACYDRWWEARKLWGQLVVDGRSLARQVTSFIDDNDEGGSDAKQRLLHLSIAFTHALRHQLRQTDPTNDIEKHIDPQDWPKLQHSQNLPDGILRLMGRELGVCRNRQLLSDILVQGIDQRITSMAEVLAACERIRNTPLPFAYMLLVRRTAYLYCFLLPLGLVSSLGLVTPLLCAIVAYTFFGLDALSEELEQPFGMTANALPLDAISRTLEINLLETLGVESLPEPLEPVDYYLH